MKMKLLLFFVFISLCSCIESKAKASESSIFPSIPSIPFFSDPAFLKKVLCALNTERIWTSLATILEGVEQGTFNAVMTKAFSVMTVLMQDLTKCGFLGV